MDVVGVGAIDVVVGSREEADEGGIELGGKDEGRVFAADEVTKVVVWRDFVGTIELLAANEVALFANEMVASKTLIRDDIQALSG